MHLPEGRAYTVIDPVTGKETRELLPTAARRRR